MTTFAIATSTSPSHLIISIKTSLLSCSFLIISPTPNILNHSLCFLKLRRNVTESFLHVNFVRTMAGSLSYQPFSAYLLTYPCTFVCKWYKIKKKKVSPFLYSFYPWRCSKWLLQPRSELLCFVLSMGKEVSFCWVKIVTKFHRPNF